MNGTTNELLYGLTDELPAKINLRAGPFTMIYENGFIRYIKYGDNEILRMIYMALRDKNWGTYSPIIENEKINLSEDSFDISYTCYYQENNTKIFSWDVSIVGERSGKIIFSIKGKALINLLKNRAGFCILHPIKNTAGEKLLITHNDDSVEQSSFPLTIAPVNPFVNIIKLQWTNQENEYILEFDGDIFEMEDHRNWTDTSFKTFCTPLSLPFPVELKAGDTIEQEVVFSSAYPLTTIDNAIGQNEIEITIGKKITDRFPALGIAASTENYFLDEKAIAAIKNSGFDYYSIDVKLSSPNWNEQLLREIDTIQQLQLPLFISLELGDDFENDFTRFAGIIEKDKKLIKYLLILQKNKPFTDQSIIDWAEKKVKTWLPNCLLGIGTATNFTELNRNRKRLNKIDFISYAIHPQEHAFDHLSLIENLSAQADTVASAKQIYADIPINISPVTLRRRLNPYAQNITDREFTNDQKADPRQMSLWAAGWTLGSFKYLAEQGTAAISYFQTVGRQGIADADGRLYPVGVLLKKICELKESSIIKTFCNDPLRCSSLLLEATGSQYLFLANHTADTLEVKLPFFVNTIKNFDCIFPTLLSDLMISSDDVIDIPAWAVLAVESRK